MLVREIVVLSKIKNQKAKDETYLKLLDNLNGSNKLANPNKHIVNNIRLVYNLLARNIINKDDAIFFIHEIIGFYSKGDYPLMSYKNDKVKRKK